MKVFKDVFGERYGILTVLKYWDIDKMESPVGFAFVTVEFLK